MLTRLLLANVCALGLATGSAEARVVGHPGFQGGFHGFHDGFHGFHGGFHGFHDGFHRPFVHTGPRVFFGFGFAPVAPYYPPYAYYRPPYYPHYPYYPYYPAY